MIFSIKNNIPYLMLYLAVSLLTAVDSFADEGIPRAERVILYQAQELSGIGNHHEASKILKDYMRKKDIKPSPLFYMILGNSLYMQELGKEAHEVFLKGLKDYPENRDLCLNSAVSAHDIGKTRVASDLFKQAFYIDGKKDGTLLYQSAVCLYELEDFKESEMVLGSLFETGLEIEKQWLKLFIHVLFSRNKFERAENFIVSCLEHHPGDKQFWKLLAQSRQSTGKLKLAAVALEAACLIPPEERKEWKVLADMYRGIDAPLKSAAILEKLCRGEEDLPLLESLADAYSQGGRYDLAVKTLQKSAILKPEYKKFLNIGKILFDLRRFKQADSAFDNAIKLNDASHEAWLWKGYSQMELKEWKKAETSFKKASESKSYKSIARANLEVVRSIIH